MKATVLRYNTIIKKENKYYVAYVPTLGISDFGKTIDEAKKNVEKAIGVHVTGLIKTKTEVPAPDNEEFYISQSRIIIPEKINFAF